MIVQNKNVKVKLAKNILELNHFLKNNYFYNLSLTDQALIFQC